MYGWRDEPYYRSDPWRGSWQGEGGGVLVNQAPHQLDLLHWYMGAIDELFGFWANLNHPYIEVEDTARGSAAIQERRARQYRGQQFPKPRALRKGLRTRQQRRFHRGSNRWRGDVYCRNVNHHRTSHQRFVDGARGRGIIKKWQKEDSDFFLSINPVEHYHQLQISEFLKAVMAGRDSAIPGEEGRKTVEIFEALYRSQRDRKPIKFPLAPEIG